MEFPAKILATTLYPILISGALSNSVRLGLFRDCIELKGIPSDRIITKNSNPELYNEVNYQWNLRIPHIYPLAYFLPTNTKDVQSAVFCGYAVNIPVIPKSGGHSYESFGFGSSDTVIIDFVKMEKIIVERTGKNATATIQPGALIGQVNWKLWNSGRFGLAMGSCLKVGIAGLVLGGGLGWYSNYFGLTLDSLLEVEMVDAKGSLQIVNEVNKRDLFWALRGVGSGYIGIATSFKFKLFKASKISIRQISLYYDLKDTALVVRSWQPWVQWSGTNSPTVLSQIFLSGKTTTQFSHAGAAQIVVSLIEVHEKQNPEPVDNDILYRTFVEIFPSTPNTTVENYDSYMDHVIENGYASVVSNKTVRQLDLNNLRSERTTPVYVKQKTFYVDKTNIDDNTMNKVAAAIKQIPDRYAVAWFGTGTGAIKNIPPTDTAFVHRNPPYSVIIRYEGENIPSEVDAGLKWIQNVAQASKSMDNGQTYQNYVDKDLKDYSKRYYGENLPRLTRIKRLWDPANYFQNPQSL